MYSWFTYSYLVDWCVVVILVILLILVWLLVGPVHRFLYQNNPSFSYPALPETIPTWLLIVLSVVVPIVVVVTYLVLMKLLISSTQDEEEKSPSSLSNQRFAHEIHNYALCLAFVIVLTLLTTQVLKVSVGRYRPDYYGYANPTPEQYVSWPSGHSSLSFATLSMLSLWLCGKTGVFITGYLWQAVLCGSPLILALFISTSRIVNYWHHPSDVEMGMLVGMFFGVTSYFLLYYPPWDKKHYDMPINRLKLQDIKTE